MSGRITHWFLPHRKNRYRSPLIQLTGLLAVILLVVAFQVGLNLIISRNPLVLGLVSNITPDQIYSRTNAVRAENGLLPLKLNSTLNQAALTKAGDMITRDYWSHISPTGQQPWSFITSAGYSYIYAGENLARNFTDNDAVIQAWLTSPTHRDNLLNTQYQDIGIAVVEGQMDGHPTVLVVQMFGATETKVVVADSAVKATNTKRAFAIPTIAPVADPAVLAPTLPPTHIPAQAIIEPAVIQVEPVENTSTLPISLFQLTKLFALTVLGLLVVVASFDYLLVSHHKLNLTAGHTLLHALFLGAIFTMIYITTQGLIL